MFSMHLHLNLLMYMSLCVFHATPRMGTNDSYFETFGRRICVKVILTRIGRRSVLGTSYTEVYGCE